MRASVSSEEIANAKISCSERSLKFLATAFSYRDEPRMGILFLRHLGSWRRRRRRSDMNNVACHKRVSGIEDHFVRRCKALDNFDRGSEVASHFDVVELDTIVRFHDSNLQSLCAEQQRIIRQGRNLP